MTITGPKTIAIVTGGGDCPGLNAVIRAVVRTAHQHQIRVLGIERGFGGIFGNGRVRELLLDDVKDILHRGGTIIGTTNRGNPFSWEGKDRGDELVSALRSLGVDTLISVGGDGSQRIALELEHRGIKVIGVPKTIDNDLDGTEVTFGFDTAVSIATEALDRLHSTAESHDRVMLLEVMGRDAGFIALHTALAGSADICLIPEIPFDISVVCDRIATRVRRGTYFSLVVVAEGAFERGGSVTIAHQQTAHPNAAIPVRYGGVAQRVAKDIGERTQREVRVTVLGHLQRGGTPTARDRVLATRMGVHAVEAYLQGAHNVLVGVKQDQMTLTPLDEALRIPKRVSVESDLVRSARSVGMSFGDF